MDDEAALRAKIAALNSQIAERKQTFAHQHPHPHPHSHQGPPHFQAARGGHRWAPYARGGRAGFPKIHQNRTLVLAGPQNGANAVQGDDAAASLSAVAPSPVNENFIKARRAQVNQLMKKSVFEREQKQWQEIQDTQRTAKRQKPNRDPSGDTQVAKPAAQHRELEIDGIRFQLKDDGSKLIRVPGQLPPYHEDATELNHLDLATTGRETPKKAKVADVEFFRTKNGNLIRAAAQNGHRYYQKRQASFDVHDSPFHPHRAIKRTPKAQCENFTKYGTLPPILY